MPGVLKVRINGAWEEVSAVATQEPPLDEVWVGQQSPDPTGTAEMWVDLSTDPPVLKFKNQAGSWLPIGSIGPEGPQGPTGISTIIIGSFGAGTGTPTALPPDGALSAGFTDPTSPAYQMSTGESLYYEAPTGTADPLDGHLFQYVTATADPVGWIDIGLIQGPPGPAGPAGADGPAGVDGADGERGPIGPPLPLGGNVWSPLVKLSAADGDVGWADGPDQFISVGWRGAFQFAGSGGGMFWRGSDQATQALVIREANGKQPRIAEGDGTGERDIIDTTNGDARYVRKGSTNKGVSWLNGWSGTCEYRYNDAIVTVTMEGVSRNAATGEQTRVKLHAYPSGVPAPWKRLWCNVFIDQGVTGGWYDNCNVEFNTDGVWLTTYDNRAFEDIEQFRCSMSWAR